MLRRIELEVLATVDRGNTISEFAMKLDHSELGDRVAAVDRGEDLEFDTSEHSVT